MMVQPYLPTLRARQDNRNLRPQPPQDLRQVATGPLLTATSFRRGAQSSSGGPALRGRLHNLSKIRDINQRASDFNVFFSNPSDDCSSDVEGSDSKELPTSLPRGTSTSSRDPGVAAIPGVFARDPGVMAARPVAEVASSKDTSTASIPNTNLWAHVSKPVKAVVTGCAAAHTKTQAPSPTKTQAPPNYVEPIVEDGPWQTFIKPPSAARCQSAGQSRPSSGPRSIQPGAPVAPYWNPAEAEGLFYGQACAMYLDPEAQGSLYQDMGLDDPADPTHADLTALINSVALQEKKEGASTRVSGASHLVKQKRPSSGCPAEKRPQSANSTASQQRSIATPRRPPLPARGAAALTSTGFSTGLAATGACTALAAAWALFLRLYIPYGIAFV